MCKKEAVRVFSPDLDIEGIGACDEHLAEVRMQLLIAAMEGDWTWFETYNKK